MDSNRFSSVCGLVSDDSWYLTVTLTDGVFLEPFNISMTVPFAEGKCWCIVFSVTYWNELARLAKNCLCI